MSTAAIMIIGNEILSGRTQDTNASMIARKLNDAGVQLRHIRVVADIEAEIILHINALRSAYDYVFTTGGIGPTHDDITTASIACAFGVAVVRHPEAEQRLRAYYTPEQINPLRLKMADIPAGATLIDNPVSAAPGFVLGNVHVMAGVPRICEAMLDGLLPTLRGGAVVYSSDVHVDAPEGELAELAAQAQAQYPDVEIGSYPHMRGGKLSTSLVIRSENQQRAAEVASLVQNMLKKSGFNTL